MRKKTFGCFVVFFVDYLELGKLIYLSFKTNKLCIIAIIAMLAV
jgi:hypothetical protein